MNAPGANDTIVAEVVINGSAGRIFEALTDPRQRVQWWGAKGKFEVTHMESDLRPGGAWLMRGLRMEGEPFTIRGEYRAVEPPTLLEFTWLPDWGEPQTVVRFDLSQTGGATTVRLTHSGFASPAAREQYQGWPWLLAMLRAHVERNGS